LIKAIHTVIIAFLNVAWHLKLFANNGIKIVQVVNRTESRMLLTNSLGTAYNSIRNGYYC
jgi:hypothetical protein